METESITHLTHQGLILVVLLSLPAVLAAAVVGLVVAVLQAATQINDQSIGQAVKLIAVMVAIFLSARWTGALMYDYADRAFSAVGLIGSQ